MVGGRAIGPIDAIAFPEWTALEAARLHEVEAVGPTARIGSSGGAGAQQPDWFVEELAQGALVGMNPPAQRGASRSGEGRFRCTHAAVRDHGPAEYAGQ